MRTQRRLVLRKDTLVELATAELESVASGQYMTSLSQAIIDCSSILRPCTTSCGLP